MDGYLPLIEDDSLHAGVAAVSIASYQQLAVPVERTLDSWVKIVESAQTAGVAGGLCWVVGHVYPPNCDRVPSRLCFQFGHELYRPPTAKGKAHASLDTSTYSLLLCPAIYDRLGVALAGGERMKRRIYFNAFHMNCVVHQSPGLWYATTTI